MLSRPRNTPSRLFEEASRDIPKAANSTRAGYSSFPRFLLPQYPRESSRTRTAEKDAAAVKNLPKLSGCMKPPTEVTDGT